jgi:MSHA biogenesis protein MshL
MKIIFAMSAAAALFSGCAMPPPMQSGIDPNIRSEIAKTADRKPETRPEAVEKAMLPPLRMEMPAVRGQPIDQRFDLSVNNAPAQQVFMSMVSGTRYSMLVHPAVTGAVSVNLKDVTLQEALDSLRDLYGYDYKVEGTRILIQPAGLQTRIFQVNYLLGARQGTSDLRVQSGSVTDSTGGGGQAAPLTTPGIVPGAAGASTRGLESSRVTTRIQSDFWTELRSSLAAIIGTGDGRSVVISPQSGVIVIRALPAEIRGVEQYLRATRIAVERQVMLEAKIIDVELGESYQSGVNWAAFGGGLSVGQVSPGTILQNRSNATGTLQATGASEIAGNPNAQTITGAAMSAFTGANLINRSLTGGSVFGLVFQSANFAALLNFLETQGKVQVLSSPRVATMNNQKAVLKVGTDEFFVTNIQSATTVATAAGTNAGTPVPTVTVQPFFSGIVLDVTPQIDENNQILLHIHPSVSQVSTDNKDINLGAAGNLRLPLAKSTINETDTIVRLSDGNIVALGGLMKMDLRDNRGGLPGVSEGGIGNLFRNTNVQVVKKEMIVLIKPTIIQGDRDWDSDLAQSRNRFEVLSTPAPASPSR